MSSRGSKRLGGRFQCLPFCLRSLLSPELAQNGQHDSFRTKTISNSQWVSFKACDRELAASLSSSSKLIWKRSARAAAAAACPYHTLGPYCAVQYAHAQSVAQMACPLEGNRQAACQTRQTGAFINWNLRNSKCLLIKKSYNDVEQRNH